MGLARHARYVWARSFPGPHPHSPPGSGPAENEPGGPAENEPGRPPDNDPGGPADKEPGDEGAPCGTTRSGPRSASVNQP